MRITGISVSFLIVALGVSFGQSPTRASAKQTSGGQTAVAQSVGVDPLALDVLRAATDALKNAKSFSFQATVAKEFLGTNDEIVTLFRRSDVTVSRPNKMRIHTTSEIQSVDLYYDAGNATLYAPDKKLYTSLPAGDTLDKVVDGLEAHDIDLPLAPLLRSDPYKTMSDGLMSAAVIGRVTIEGKTFHHLVFTEKDAEWQLWVEAGAKPTVRRAEIIYTSLPRQPRVTVDFTNWNLNATPNAGFFTFSKPADAKSISFLEIGAGDKK